MSRILIMHYHLNPGGVTRIIESQVRCLKESNQQHDILLLTGHCDNRSFYDASGVELIIYDKLNYLAEKEVNYSLEYDLIRQFLEIHIQKDDILHIHNLNLGKNPLLTLAISEYAIKGQYVINHAHDFAEDRPQNMKFTERIIGQLFGRELHSILYPDQKNYVFATLNSSDRNRLIQYGVDENSIFLLPNPVDFSGFESMSDGQKKRKSISKKLGIDPAKKIVTYPVRVIRRKNIGEYILLAFLLKDKASWLVTQPPRNPIEFTFYKEWQNFCLTWKIPLIFEAGLKTDFEELIQSSDFCFTTSTREGFGMVYMEPWLFNTPVIGRDIPYITSDLKQSGMFFPLLYDSVLIPFKNSVKDFGGLNEEEQRNLIILVIEDLKIREKLLQTNPFINNLLDPVEPVVINNNRDTILHDYSLKNYAERLERIYRKLTK